MRGLNMSFYFLMILHTFNHVHSNSSVFVSNSVSTRTNIRSNGTHFNVAAVQYSTVNVIEMIFCAQSCRNRGFLLVVIYKFNGYEDVALNDSGVANGSPIFVYWQQTVFVTLACRIIDFECHVADVDYYV
jgi:hypothetical protein